VIGADGVRSVIRRALYGDDIPPIPARWCGAPLLRAAMFRRRCWSLRAISSGSGPAAISWPIICAAPRFVNIVTPGTDTDKWVVGRLVDLG